MLKDLQAKIPLLKKKSAKAEEENLEEADEEVSGDDATNTVVGGTDDASTEGGQSQSSSMLMRLRDKIMKRKPEEEQELTEVGESDDGEEKPKKPKVDKKRLIIQGVIALGIVLAIAQEYIPGLGSGGGEEEIPTEGAPKLKPRPKPKKKDPAPTTDAGATTTEGTETPLTETPSTETPSTETPVTVGETPSDTTGGVGTETTPDATAVTVTEGSTGGADIGAITPTDPTGGATSEGVTGGETTPTDSTLATGGDAGGVGGETTTTYSSTTTEPTTTDTTTTEPTSTEPDMGTVTSPDKIDGGMMGGGAPDMTEQMLKELEKEANVPKVRTPVTEYAAPPDYEFKGRGLVYNCVGKHWACVDGPSYRRCEDNSSSLKFLKKKTECYPFNVYETLKGCEAVQNRMVSSSAKTDFCDEL